MIQAVFKTIQLLRKKLRKRFFENYYFQMIIKLTVYLAKKNYLILFNFNSNKTGLFESRKSNLILI